jgi:microcystin-dependent protein
MSEPYLGEIDLFAFDYPPYGWAQCNGQLLPVAQYVALYTLIGKSFGGDGVLTFALPNLQSRVAVGQGSGSGLTVIVGEQGGSETVTLATAQIPAHTHSLDAATAGGTTNVPGASVVLGQAVGQDAHGEVVPYDIYAADAAPAAALDAAALASTGGGEPHTNLMPYLTLNYCIALFGVFPSQN